METINVRDLRERISQVLDRVRSGEEIIVLRRGSPAARIVKPPSGHATFRSRKDLRTELPPMRRRSEEEVRELRNGERF